MSLRPARIQQFQFLPRRAPRPSVVSVTDTFVSLLVAAGACRKHAPRSRFFATAPQRSSHASEAPIPVQDSAEENRAEHTVPTSANEATQAGGGRHEHIREDEIPMKPCLTGLPAFRRATAIAPVSESLEHTKRELPVEIRNLLKGTSKFKEIDLKNLFDFYVDALGYELGVESLKVVLSNPKREMAAQTPVEDDRHLKDEINIPAVARIVSLLEDKHSSNQMIFRTYKDIPSPGVAHLSYETRSRLLNRFANPPRPRPVYGKRYLLIIDDMCEARLSISPAYWTAAIHAAGKCSPKTTDSDISTAVDLWRRMENEGKVKSSSVTFNVLFDIAIKAGRFKFAENILKEAKKRGIDFSRFGRVAQIYYRGVQGDAIGVREAYREFREAGEVVDTVVLNAVMASLIRADRFDLAEQMYERMGEVHEALVRSDKEMRPKTLYPQPFDNYAGYRKASKKLGRVLGMSAFLRDKLPEQHRTLQAALPLTPDAKTFHILLSYHAFQSGDLERFIALLRDMEVQFSIPPQGMVYIFLFQGFSRNGGTSKSAWTFKRLQEVWAAFLRAVDHSNNEIRQRPKTIKRLAKLVWENPLTGNTNTVMKQMPSTYRRKGDTAVSEYQTQSPMDSNDESRSSPSNDTRECEEDDEDDDDDEDEDDWQYENTVYLGRKVIVSALYAYYVCGGRTAVIELWPQIERHWRSRSRKLADVVAVTKVLQRLTA